MYIFKTALELGEFGKSVLGKWVITDSYGTHAPIDYVRADSGYYNGKGEAEDALQLLAKERGYSADYLNHLSIIQVRDSYPYFRFDEKTNVPAGHENKPTISAANLPKEMQISDPEKYAEEMAKKLGVEKPVLGSKGASLNTQSQ